MVMPANNTSGIVHWVAGKAPGSMGLLYTPARSERPVHWLPYALDNGAFALAVKGLAFNWDAWAAALDRYLDHMTPPRWLVVPDVPFFGEETVRLWNDLAPVYRSRTSAPLALAVQNGMTVESVKALPVQPDVIFVGGDTEWKWRTVGDWCASFPRVHVARVNGRPGLDTCVKHGAESCDGSGWFRGREAQLVHLFDFLADFWGLDKSELRDAARSTRFKNQDQMVLFHAKEPTSG